VDPKKAKKVKKFVNYTSKAGEADPKVFTIGHSTRTREEFLYLLKKQGITTLVDIRTIPKSRRNPQFNQDIMSKYLAVSGIDYQHIKGLGGLRHPSKDSINTGWQNSSFRGFADYMQTKKFIESLDDLIRLISREAEHGGKVAYMCAEAVPWRCHRSLVSDALTVRDFCVIHILSQETFRVHKITDFAKVQERKIMYPGS
jgi:uncharacterized protein (DUF488 family)